MAKLVGFLVLGTIVNVSLALSCAWWLPRPLVSSDQIESVWPAPISFDPLSSEPWPERPLEVSRAAWLGFDTFIAHGLHRGDRSQFQSVTKAGLPMRSLYSSSQYIGANPLPLLRPDHPLPTRPLWPGFAFNTIFYAGILWMALALLRTPAALRRRHRLKRGLCPACAYPIGASIVCTECGCAANGRAATKPQ